MAEKAKSLDGGSDTVIELATEIETLSRALDQATNDLDELRREQSETAAELESIEAVFTRVRSQLGQGSPGREFALILLNEQRSLPKTGEIEKAIANRRAGVSTTRAKIYELDRLLRRQSTSGELSREVASDSEQDLLARKRQLAKQLQETLENLNSGRVELSATEQAYMAEVELFRKYLDAKLFWVASSPPIYRGFILNLRDSAALIWNQMVELPRLPFGEALRRSGVFFTLSGLLLVGCLAWRRVMSRRIDRIGDEMSRLSRDRWIITVEALFLTFLKALPLPLLIFILARLFKVIGENSFHFAVGESLATVAPVFFMFTWLISLCQKKGVLVRHFGWELEMLAFLRHHLISWASLYLPLVLIATIGVKWGQVAMIDGLSRLGFVLAMLWSALVLQRLLNPKNLLARRYLQSRPESWIAHLRNVWYLVAVSIPLVLAAFAIAGLFLTAFTLHLHIQMTVAIVVLGPIFYGILARACAVHERRIRFHRAMDQREPGSLESGGDSIGATQSDQLETLEEADKPIDLSAVGEQTRHLLRFLTFILVGYGIWMVWSGLNDTLELNTPHDDSFGIGTLFRALLVFGDAVISSPSEMSPGLSAASRFDRPPSPIGTARNSSFPTRNLSPEP